MSKPLRLAAALGLALSAPCAHAATLLADGTLNTAGDLTRIDDSGTVLEFLDWSETVGQSVPTALATYAPLGFSVATETEMTALFDAFGMIYAFSIGPAGVDLTTSGNVTPSEATAFVASLGATLGSAAFATYSESTSPNPYSYLCVSVSTCSPPSFTVDINVSGGNTIIGIALVREGALTPVPLPAGFALMLGGMAALGGVAYRKRRRPETAV